MKASEQAKHIHAELSTKVVKIKNQYAEQTKNFQALNEQLSSAESRHSVSVRALQSQIEEMEWEQEKLQIQRDTALAQEKATKENADRARETFEKKSDALDPWSKS